MGVSENEKLVIFLTEGLKTLNLKSRLQFDRESDTEIWITLPDLGISVFCDSEGTKKKTISSNGHIRIPEYQVYTMKYIEASRWEPEDMDLVLRGTFDRVDSTVAEVFALAVKGKIFDMIEGVGAELDAAVIVPRRHATTIRRAKVETE